MKIELKENERLDDLQRNGLKIIQKTDGFCFGMDAVLLSGFAQVKPGETVLDLGTGTGIIPLLLSAKTEGKRFVGLEIQEAVAEMAERSVAFNELENKIQIMRVPLVGWILSKAGVFGVDRGSADLKAVKTALKFLKEGDKLLMFPEGTRVHEGENVQVKTGAALFATRAGVPILPVYVPPKKRLFRPNTVVIGQAYRPAYAGRKPTPEELQAIARDLMERVHALGEPG